MTNYSGLCSFHVIKNLLKKSFEGVKTHHCLLKGKSVMLSKTAHVLMEILIKKNKNLHFFCFIRKVKLSSP